MKKEYVLEKLNQRYIEPTKKKRGEFIGVEIEMPIVNLNKEAVDFDIVQGIADEFIRHFDFTVVGTDDDGYVYSAENKENGDILSFDCSYNNLELSFGKEKDLHEVNRRFNTYLDFLQSSFGSYNYILTGMGVNPYRNYNHNVPIENGRYRMLFHHLHSYTNYDLPMYFHDYPEYGTFSSASQVQLDVDYDKLPVTINAFTKLEPIKALLFNNSVLLGEHEDMHCCRDMFWENSTHGINPHNIGMFDCEINSAEDMLNYISTTSIYCVERGDKYINFPPINIVEYFEKETVRGEYFDGKGYRKIDVIPDISDIKYLRTFKFEDLTFRGTIEFRSVCCQPLDEEMTVAAFHIGLMDNADKLDEILSRDNVLYHNGYTPGELRKMFVKSTVPDFVNEDGLYSLAKEIVDLSAAGLRVRGLGEEEFLAPLYDRINRRTNPAKTIFSMLDSGISLEDIIIKYSASPAQGVHAAVHTAVSA